MIIVPCATTHTFSNWDGYLVLEISKSFVRIDGSAFFWLLTLELCWNQKVKFSNPTLEPTKRLEVRITFSQRGNIKMQMDDFP